MNAENGIAKKSAGGLDWEVLLPLVLAVVVGALAVTSQSFWMDESSTGLTAFQPTPGTWWRSLLLNGGSNSQMPFYMFYVWFWEKIFDPTEWMLRAANIPWLVLGFLAVPRRQGLFLFTLAASPFLWYYLNEFRPYIMQVSSSLLMLGAVWRLAEMPESNRAHEKIWVGCFGLGAILLAGSSLLGVIWMAAGGAAAAAVLGWRRSWQVLCRNWIVPVVMGPLLLVLAAYYLWSLKHGARAVLGFTNVSNVLFVFYELTGFSGFGPGRLDIRSGGLAVFRPFLVPLLLYAAVLGCVLFAGCKCVLQKTPRRVWLGVAAALGAAVVLLVAVGVVMHFRVLGRHFAPLAPCLLLLVAFGLRHLEERGGWRRFLVVAFLLSSLVSALSLRFCERHTKDDNRAAAALASGASRQGKVVWWCADGSSALFYNVPLALARPDAVFAPGQVWWVNDAPEAWVTNAVLPDLVLLSKPDIHDAHGFNRALLERNHYQVTNTFQAFTVWQKP